MCGINGFNWRDEDLIQKMNEATSHRGPDAKGVFFDEGVSLGQNRLSIIDLSAEANQPMFDNSKDLVIVFNGEIYNFKELKKELEDDYNFQTKSDTEVILAGYKKWGKEVVTKLNGIFAFVIWDKKEKEFFCARDHMGVKPFYYYWKDGKFIFSSGVNSILAHDIPRVLDLESFNEYLRVLYVPEPRTMIRGVNKLPPGHTMTVKDGRLYLSSYYIPEINIASLSYREAKEAVKKTVEEAVERQLISDVPVGIYLSGGIDSSIVLASASKVKKNIKTFSVSFALGEGEESEKFNKDSDLAKKTALHFGADHHVLLVTAEDVARELIPTIESMDDPISNPTAIPMRLLSRFAKKEVTVVLSGNGGDEFFGGYERYRMGRRVDLLGRIPFIKYLLPKKIRKALEMNALDRLAQFEFEKDFRLDRVVSEKYLNSGHEVKESFARYIESDLDKTEALMMADVRSWLPDQALLLGDKMSMQGSVEERVPLLDKKILDLSLSLPLKFKVTPFETKKILKDAFRDILPKELFKEPKRGWFSPGAKWLRRPEILSIVDEVLSPDYYPETKDIFDWSALENMLKDHVEKKEYNLTVIWAIMTFQVWAKKNQIKL